MDEAARGKPQRDPQGWHAMTSGDVAKQLDANLESGLDGGEVVMDAAGQRLKFPFRAIADAKLVLTDKLIQEDLKARKQ